MGARPGKTLLLERKKPVQALHHRPGLRSADLVKPRPLLSSDGAPATSYRPTPREGSLSMRGSICGERAEPIQARPGDAVAATACCLRRTHARPAPCFKLQAQ